MIKFPFIFVSRKKRNSGKGDLIVMIKIIFSSVIWL